MFDDHGEAQRFGDGCVVVCVARRDSAGREDAGCSACLLCFVSAWLERSAAGACEGEMESFERMDYVDACDVFVCASVTEVDEDVKPFGGEAGELVFAGAFVQRLKLDVVAFEPGSWVHQRVVLAEHGRRLFVRADEDADAHEVGFPFVGAESRAGVASLHAKAGRHMTASLNSRRPSDSLTTMTEYVLPTHANAIGNVFGGQILAWIDLCAAICAQRHAGKLAVTAEFDDVSFEAPIKVGQVVLLRARITAAFRTSVEIVVDVSGEDAQSGLRWDCARAFVTFVAMQEVDGVLRPVVVPALLCETEEDRALVAEANERRAHRLLRRKRATEKS